MIHTILFSLKYNNFCHKYHSDIVKNPYEIGKIILVIFKAFNLRSAKKYMNLIYREFFFIKTKYISIDIF